MIPRYLKNTLRQNAHHEPAPERDAAMSITDDLSQGACADCPRSGEIVMDGWCGSLPAVAQQIMCPEGFTSYAIKPGESLISIARSFNISLSVLLQYNPQLNPYYYRANELICVPSQPAPCTSGQLYTVVPGDTFKTIADQNGVTLEDILKANPYINPRNLIPGQVICLPPKTAEPSGCSGTSYTVRSTDTLSSILITYNLSYASLAAANPSIDLDSLIAGTVLCIPSSANAGQCPGIGKSYTVQQGDTATSIAQAQNVSLDALMKANPFLKPGDFIEGRVICVPGA